MAALPETMAALRQLLTERFPSAPPRRAGLLPTGIATLDDTLGGGLPLGGLTEVVSQAPSSGGQLLMLSLLAATRALRGRIALVDGRDAFDPQSHPSDLLQHVLWVRCHALTEALQAADILVRDANLALVLMDIRGFEARAYRRLPPTAWYRLQRAVEQSGMAALILTTVALVGNAQLRLTLSRPFQLGDFDVAQNELAARMPVDVPRSRSQPEMRIA